VAAQVVVAVKLEDILMLEAEAAEVLWYGVVSLLMH